MNYVREFVEDAAIGVNVVERPEDLGGFLAPGVAAAVWNREVGVGFQAWIDAIPPAQLPSCRMIVKPDAVFDAVLEVCDQAAMPDTPLREWFVADIALLAANFARLTGAPYMRVRLDVVTTDACRKFHLDAVTARLVCTYRGPGTHYGIARDGADPDPVDAVPTGAPILLRGSLWPEPPVSGLVHRSPPIAGTGKTRLVLVLDPLDRAQEDVALP
ncbi:MAG: DUF1826 domain-containing protein [Pseudomonadota bacterium]